ncbi:MAG: hypothetical protein GY822_10365 [Deltaproteobacteria bacterium]|nr:hypothetical protein [Deltaproteobacteria bacterium]
MDLSKVVTVDQLNFLADLQLYKLTPGLASAMLQRFLQLGQLDEPFGDEGFWSYMLGEDEAQDDGQQAQNGGQQAQNGGQSSEIQDGGQQSPNAQDGGQQAQNVGQSSEALQAKRRRVEEPPIFYEIKLDELRTASRFRTTAARYSLQLMNMDACRNADDMLYTAFSSLIETAFAGADANDKVGISIAHEGLTKPIGIPFCRREVLTADKLMGLMEKVGCFLCTKVKLH